MKLTGLQKDRTGSHAAMQSWQSKLRTPLPRAELSQAPSWGLYAGQAQTKCAFIGPKEDASARVPRLLLYLHLIWSVYFQLLHIAMTIKKKKKKKKLSPFLMGLSIIMLLLGVVFMLWERSKNWESLLLLSFYFCRSVLLEILSLVGDVVDDLKSLLLELSFFIYDEDVKFWDKKRKFYLL